MKKTMNVWKWFQRTGLLVLCWLALPMLVSDLRAQVCDTLRLTWYVDDAHRTKSFLFAGTLHGSFIVDWGDGMELEVKSNFGYEEEVCHEYADTGSYLVHLYALTADVKITYLKIPNSLLMSLDVGGCIAMERLDCSNNQLDSLDVRGCVFATRVWKSYLNCSNNQLTYLNVSGCEMLERLDCSNNQLTSLDVSDCAFSSDWDSYLDCSNNQLTSLNVSGCDFSAGLGSYLDCSNNQLTSLDVSQNVNLNKLDCSFNQLTSLDLSKNIHLGSLDFSNNIREVNLSEDNGMELRMLTGLGLVVDKIYDLRGGRIEDARFIFETDTISYRYEDGFINWMNDDYQRTRFKLYTSAPLTPVVATPEFSIPDGEVNIGVFNVVDSGTVITLNCTTEGASIYYTVNGSAPTTESILYKDGITMDQPVMVIRAIAIKDKCISSEIVKASFRFKFHTANEAALSAAPIAYVRGRTAYLSDGLGEVEAFTSTGQRVYRGFDRSIALPQPGVYILRVVADGRRCKVVVK